MKGITLGEMMWRRGEEKKEVKKLYNIVDRRRLSKREASYKFTDDKEMEWAMSLPPLLRNQFLKYPKGRYLTEEDWAVREQLLEIGVEIGAKFKVTKAPWVKGLLITDGKKVAGIVMRKITKHKDNYTKRKLITEGFNKLLGVPIIEYYGDVIKLEEELKNIFGISVEN